MSQLFVNRLAIPLGIAAYAASTAIYDVPGGTRAVLFDRLSGEHLADHQTADMVSR